MEKGKGFHPKKQTKPRNERCCANCKHYKNGPKTQRVNGRSYMTFPRPKGRRTYKDGYCDHPKHPWGNYHAVYKYTTCCPYYNTPLTVCNWCYEKIDGERPFQIMEERWEGDPSNIISIEPRFYHKDCYKEKWRLDFENEKINRERELSVLRKTP